MEMKKLCAGEALLEARTQASVSSQGQLANQIAGRERGVVFILGAGRRPPPPETCPPPFLSCKIYVKEGGPVPSVGRGPIKNIPPSHAPLPLSCSNFGACSNFILW